MKLLHSRIEVNAGDDPDSRVDDVDMASASAASSDYARGSNRRAEREEQRMAEFVRVADATEVAEGTLEAFDVGGVRVAVANVGGTFHAFDDTCTHLQCSLADGDLDGTVVTCSCHGSRFDVTTGELLRGPAQKPVRSYPARVENDALQIEV